MQKIAIKIAPADHGKRMSLDDFDQAEVQEGYLYELSRGVITVSDVPNRPHLIQVRELRQRFSDYRSLYPNRIDTIAGSGECKILLTELASERHPDIAIYKFPPLDEEDLWATWVPDVAIEVVSAESAHRDYVEKREEYLLFGVREYWIVDAARQEMLVLKRRGGKWTERIVKPPEVYETKVLPGFALDCGAVFAAAGLA